jgi:hypothetical protein
MSNGYTVFADPVSRRAMDLNTVMVNPSSSGPDGVGVFPYNIYDRQVFPEAQYIGPPSGFERGGTGALTHVEGSQPSACPASGAVVPPAGPNAISYMPRDITGHYLIGVERQSHPQHFSRYSRPRSWWGGHAMPVWSAGHYMVETPPDPSGQHAGACGSGGSTTFGCDRWRQPKNMAPRAEDYAPENIQGVSSATYNRMQQGKLMSPWCSYGVFKGPGVPL